MKPEIVVVPDMDAVDLTTLVEKERKLTFLNSDYKQWDYYRSIDGSEILGRGRKYEALIWKPDLKPNENILLETVRNHFRELKASPHAGAFIQWRRCSKQSGFHATVLEEDQCCHARSGLLFPFSDFGGYGDRELDFFLIQEDCAIATSCSFLAFREISS